MTVKTDTIVSLYQRGVSSHELRLTRIDDSEHHLSDHRGKIDNHYLQLRRSEILEAVRVVSADFEDEVLLGEIALEVLSNAERVLCESLSSGSVIGIGYSKPSEQHPQLVPTHHWHFLTIDFDESNAVGEEMSYVGLHFLEHSQLSEAELQILADSQPLSSDSKLPAVQTSASPPDPLSVFREMEDLTWPEVHISLVAGDLIEVSARGETKRAPYGAFGLIDRRIGQGQLNRAGHIFLAMATRSTSIREGDKKNLSRLRKALKESLGIGENPFYMQTHVQPHTPIFTLVDARDKADQRAKERTGHHPYDDSVNYDVGSNLSEDLADRTEEYPIENVGKDDPAAPYLKK